MKKIVAIILVVIFATIGIDFYVAGNMRALASNSITYIVSDDDVDEAYDLSKNGEIDVADLVCVKNAIDKGEMTQNDFEMVEAYLKTGEWIYGLSYIYRDLSSMEYSPKSVDFLKDNTSGKLIKLSNVYGVLRLTFLKDTRLVEICVSDVAYIPSYNVEAVFDYEDSFYLIYASSKNNKYEWSEVEKSSHPGAHTPKKYSYIDCESASMSNVFENYYDLNEDNIIDVFDMICARDLVSENKMGILDVTMLKDYLLTGQWTTNVSIEKVDMFRVSCYDTTFNRIFEMHYIDSEKINTNTVKLRFMKNANIVELYIDRKANDETIMEMIATYIVGKNQNINTDVGCDDMIILYKTTDGHVAWGESAG